MSLIVLREELSAVDRRILELIAKRLQIVGSIGRDKLSTGRATRDYEREKMVLKAARARARALSISPDLAEEVIRSLIQSSLASQERHRVAAEGQGDGRDVLVIGGAGKMGGWFIEFFESQGFATSCADPRVDPGARQYTDWLDAGLDYDIIVVATPLAVSNRILCELAERKPRSLVFDIGSLKGPLREGLMALAAAGCRVTSMHPMFGPDTELLSGRHLIFVDVGSAEATAAAKALFAATMVEQLDMGLDEHDRLISYVLGLSHILNIAFFTALAESHEVAPKLQQMSSSTFDAQLQVAAGVAQDNPHLYFEIQRLNDFGLQSLDSLCDSVLRLRQMVADGDEEGFVQIMEQGREYLAARA